MATLGQMGIPAAGFGILQPKQKQKWQVTFSNFATLVPGADSRNITAQVKIFERPNLAFDEIAIHRYNNTAYVAGKYIWEPTSLTVEDDITGLVSTAIQGQLETQQRLIGGDLPSNYMNSAATGSDYKFGMTLQLLDGNETVVETWIFEGCWIKSSNYGDLDYSSSEAVTIQLSIRFDQARQVLTGQGFGTALGGNLS
jgi:hypothetical protein